MCTSLYIYHTSFTEGQNSAPTAIVIKGDAARLNNRFLFDASAAVGEFWKVRGYDPKKPEVTKAKLGYALDTYDATAYVVTRHLHKSMPSADEAAFIGKRITNIIGDSGTIGKKLKPLRKKGKDGHRPLFQPKWV